MNQTLAGNYRLEVSSPGMDRPLRSIEAVARFTGKRAAVTTYEARDGRRNFEGTLLEPDGHQVGLRLEQDQEHWFEWAGIKSIRLVVVDPWAGLRQSRAPGSPGGRRPEEKSR
jgi:ribosome maturation factor RimP